MLAQAWFFPLATQFLFSFLFHDGETEAQRARLFTRAFLNPDNMVPGGSTMGLLLPFTQRRKVGLRTQRSPLPHSILNMGQKQDLAPVTPREGGEVSLRGSRPFPRPCSPSPPPIPLLYDLFYEHGLAASMLPWEPVGAGSWQLDLGLAILSGEPVLRAGGGPGLGSVGPPPEDAWRLPVPLLCSSSQEPRSSGTTQLGDHRAAGSLEGLGLTGK